MFGVVLTPFCFTIFFHYKLIIIVTWLLLPTKWLLRFIWSITLKDSKDVFCCSQTFHRFFPGHWHIKCQCCSHIETTQLLCFANPLTGFCMRATLALNGLNWEMFLQLWLFWEYLRIFLQNNIREKQLCGTSFTSKV